MGFKMGEDLPMGMMRLLKIGGSVITDKTKPYTALRDVIDGIAEAIARVRGKRFILGHGGGSFPHVSAKRYRTHEGFVNEESPFGLGKVHYDATWINQIFVESLHRAGVPAMSFHPSSFLLAERDELAGAFLDPLFVALDRGVVPVVYGDVVVDRVKGSTIFSTERVLEVIATAANESVVIGMAEKFGGVFTEDPAKNPDAELIEEVNPENYERVLSYLGGSHGIDVTGGMTHKVKELYSLARRGIPSVVFKGTPENVERFLRGEKVTGTYFR